MHHIFLRIIHCKVIHFGNIGLTNISVLVWELFIDMYTLKCTEQQTVLLPLGNYRKIGVGKLCLKDFIMGPHGKKLE